MPPWYYGLIVVAVVGGAVAASGDLAIIPATLVVGGVLALVHLIFRRAFGRVLATPAVPPGATPAERARILRPHLVRLSLVIVVMVAAALTYAFAASDGRPAVAGVLYLALPLVVVVIMVGAALRKPHD